jgi:hypothetical protein
MHPRKKLAIAKRRQQVAELYLKGWTQGRIAEHLRILQSTVSEDIKAVAKEWKESAVRDFDLAREVEVKKVTLIEAESWAGWDRSQKPAQEARIKDGDQANAVKTMKSRIGDPRFLELALKCSAARRAMLDLDLATPVVEVHSSGVQLADLAELRRNMLNEARFVDYCRDAAIDVDAQPAGQEESIVEGVASPGLPGPVDSTATPASPAGDS